MKVHNIKNTQFGDDRWFTLSTVPDHVYFEIGQAIKDIKQNPSAHKKANYNLAGHIDDEYELNKIPLTEKFVMEEIMALEKDKNYGASSIALLNRFFSKNEQVTAPSFTMDSSYWINFQQKHEYNPKHVHSGLYSWVIWYKIPYTKQDEVDKGPGEVSYPRHNVNGEFVFSTTDTMMPNMFVDTVVSVERDLEKKLIIFPSHTAHSVYPFYSTNDERISIAGNVYISLLNDFKNKLT